MTEKGSPSPEITQLPDKFFISLGIKPETVTKLVDSVYNPDENGFEEFLYTDLGENEQKVREYIDTVRQLYPHGPRQMVEDLTDKGLLNKE